MYIINTTFNIDLSISEKCINSIEELLIPTLMETELFSKSVFCEVFAGAYSDGKTYSLQLFCPSKAHLSQFKKFHNHHISNLVQVYKGKLVYFQTSMQVVSIKKC